MMENRTPIEMLLDGIEWKPINPDGIYNLNGDLPVATHQGILHIEDIELRVYQLSDGRRVIEQQDMVNLFKNWSGEVFNEQ